MKQLAMAMFLAVLLQAAPQNPATGASREGAATPQATPPAAAPSPATTSEAPSEAGESSKPMSPSEANAAIDKLRQAVRESIESGGGPTREMSPETQKAIAEAADKFLSDPAIRGAIAGTIRDVNPVAMRGIQLGLISTVAFFAVVALIAALLYWRSRASMRARMEFHQQVLAKFTSGQEFAQFLNTKGSQQLLEGMWGGQVNFKERLLKHVRLGAIFGVLGLGLLALAIFTSDDGYGFLAVLCLGLGIGFLVSARVSYRLSEKMGLLRENGSGGVSAPGSQP